MSLSVGAASTNDVSSTAHSTAATEAGDASDSGLFDTAQRAGDKAARTAHTLTSDGIIKECINQGFYRNPICNEKLYLHNKGYDSIAPTAFELYTDVKVLWLEGNALAALPCGGELIQTQRPRNKGVFYSESSSSSFSDEDKCEAMGKVQQQQQPHHADPFRGLEETDGATADTLEQAQKDERRPHRHHSDRLPRIASVPVDDRDAFSSLYPTVRQLYLHNNIFRTMPDLSRFERLDAINLANNFFTTIEPHCPHWDRGLRDWREAQEEEERSALGHGQGSHERKASAQAEDEVTVVPADVVDQMAEHEPKETSTAVATLSPEEARQRRAELLAEYKDLVESHSAFCPHAPIPETTATPSTGIPMPSRKLPRVPHALRNPCSSVRTLNLAANHIQSFRDLLGLLCYKAVTVLDLSQNRIDDGEALLLILEKMEKLRSLKLSGNPCVRTLPKYRKTILARCPSLLHLDDRPVFPEERRLVNAWAAGGESAELQERAKIKAENEAAVRKRVDDFRKLLNSYRATPSDSQQPQSLERCAGEAGARSMDPSHADYLDAISTPTPVSATQAANERREEKLKKRQQRVREAARPNSDPDASPTSSEEEEEDSDNEAVAESDRVAAVADRETRVAAAPPRAARVLSSNGDHASWRARVQQDGASFDEAEDDTLDDVYIPS